MALAMGTVAKESVPLICMLAVLVACAGEPPAPPPAPPAPPAPAAPVGASSPLSPDQVMQLVDAVRQLQGTITQLSGSSPNLGGGEAQDQLKRRLGMEVEAVLDFLEDDQTAIPGKDYLASIIDLVTSGTGQFSQMELDQLESDFQGFLQEAQDSVPGSDLMVGGPEH